MFGSEILDVAIGVALVFLMMSFLATAIREAIESVVKARAVYLERGIRQLLDDIEGTTSIRSSSRSMPVTTTRRTSGSWVARCRRMCRRGTSPMR